MNFLGTKEVLNVGPPPGTEDNNPEDSVTALTQSGNLIFIVKTVKCSLVCVTVGGISS